MISFVQVVWTVIAMALFIGIVIWAFSSKRKNEFDAAAQLPLEEDRDTEDIGERH